MYFYVTHIAEVSKMIEENKDMWWLEQSTM